MQRFDPFFKNPHLATIAGNFWSRPKSELRWAVQPVLYQTEPEAQVLVHAQAPAGKPRGEVILVHGLEGSSDSGYARSMAHAALHTQTARGTRPARRQRPIAPPTSAWVKMVGTEVVTSRDRAEVPPRRRGPRPSSIRGRASA